MDLKVLLGDKYKEGMTETEAFEVLGYVSKKVLSDYVPKDEVQKNYVTKEVSNKHASDAADWKKKYNELLPEQDRIKQETDSKITELLTQVEEMQAREKIAETKARYMALEFSEEHASRAAQAIVSGKTDDLMAVLNEHQTALKQQFEQAQVQNGFSAPGAAAGAADTTGAGAVSKNAQQIQDLQAALDATDDGPTRISIRMQMQELSQEQPT